MQVPYFIWLRGLDLNQGPSGYEPDELPDCSTPRQCPTFIYQVCLVVNSFLQKYCGDGSEGVDLTGANP